MIPIVKVQKVIIVESGSDFYIYDMDGRRLYDPKPCPNGDLQSCQINRDAIRLHEYAVKNLPGFDNNCCNSIEINVLEWLKGKRRC